jgi:hypothetical protein
VEEPGPKTRDEQVKSDLDWMLSRTGSSKIDVRIMRRWVKAYIFGSCTNHVAPYLERGAYLGMPLRADTKFNSPSRIGDQLHLEFGEPSLFGCHEERVQTYMPQYGFISHSTLRRGLLSKNVSVASKVPAFAL